MYVVALLRCIHPSAMRYMEHKYETSFLSRVSPGLDLRSEHLSARMKELGRERGKMEAFMQEFVPSGDGFAIFDGTSMVCHSRNLREAQRGYNPHCSHDPQVNLLYAIALKDGGIAPVFYKRYPGSIRDVSAFRNLANAMGLTTALVIADKGFTQRAECERMERTAFPISCPCDATVSNTPARRCKSLDAPALRDASDTTAASSGSPRCRRPDPPAAASFTSTRASAMPQHSPAGPT